MNKLSWRIFVFLPLVVLTVACAPGELIGDTGIFSPAGVTEQRAQSAGRPAEAPGLVPAQPPMPEPAAPQADFAGGAALQAGQLALPSLLDRMIIRTAELRLGVPNVRQAIAEVEQAATLAGGFVFASTFNESERQDTGTVTIRVPSDQRTFNELMDRLANVDGATVLERSIRSDDVTEEFTDLDAQLRNLRATEQRLLALLERATRLEDVLTLERELSSVRGRIERLEGRMRLLENRVELATIAVHLREVPPGTRPTEAWNPFAVAAVALAALVEVTRGFLTALIWLAVWSPLYLPLIFAAYLLRRYLQQSRATQ